MAFRFSLTVAERSTSRIRYKVSEPFTSSFDCVRRVFINLRANKLCNYADDGRFFFARKVNRVIMGLQAGDNDGDEAVNCAAVICRRYIGFNHAMRRDVCGRAVRRRRRRMCSAIDCRGRPPACSQPCWNARPLTLRRMQLP